MGFSIKMCARMLCTDGLYLYVALEAWRLHKLACLNYGMAQIPHAVMGVTCKDLQNCVKSVAWQPATQSKQQIDVN